MQGQVLWLVNAVNICTEVAYRRPRASLNRELHPGRVGETAFSAWEEFRNPCKATGKAGGGGQAHRDTAQRSREEKRSRDEHQCGWKHRRVERGRACVLDDSG